MMSWLKTAWYVLSLRCEEAERVRALPHGASDRAGSRLGERVHSTLCSSCRRARKRLRELNRAIDELKDPGAEGAAPPMPSDARARIARALEKQEDFSA